MYRREILATINLAHHFNSAFTAEQVYRYLRIPLAPERFGEILSSLKTEGTVFERNGALFTRDLERHYQQKRIWSRDLFRRHRRHLRWITGAPWVKYAALTGANAFESCGNPDDIDIFIVTRHKRLWLCYVYLVILSKVFGKREILCINYLVDEKNMAVQQQDYFTAVQIMQMIPLFDNHFTRLLIEQNNWIYDYLPNAGKKPLTDHFYVLRNGNGTLAAKRTTDGLLSRMNSAIFARYRQRLKRKYPDYFGKGIVLSEGRAKLNRIDHHDIYESIYNRIFEES